MEKPVVLIVEENTLVRSAAVERLRAAGFEVLEAANSAEAEQVLKAPRWMHCFYSYAVNDDARGVRTPAGRGRWDAKQVSRLLAA